MRYIYAVMGVVVGCQLVGQQGNSSSGYRERRLKEKGCNLYHAIAKGSNSFIEEGLRRYSYDQIKEFIQYGAPDAFDYALRVGNPEAATILAKHYKAEDLSPSLQNNLLKHIIYNKHNHCLPHLCHIFDYMTWHALANSILTPFEHIVGSGNTQALYVMLGIYDKVNAVVPHTVQYKSIIAALRWNDTHFHILFHKYQDTVALAVNNDLPTPMHYAVVLQHNEALKALCKKTTSYYYDQALRQKKADPLWHNIPATPEELAYRCNHKAISILSSCRNAAVIDNYF